MESEIWKFLTFGCGREIRFVEFCEVFFLFVFWPLVVVAIAAIIGGGIWFYKQSKAN